MRTSFAQSRCRFALRAGVAILLPLAVLCACATLPPPTSELSAAQQSLDRANAADADQYAADAVTLARNELSQAQAAMAAGRENDARALALATAADADFATATSVAARTRAEYAQRRAEILELQQRLQLQADAPVANPLDIPDLAAAGMPADPASRLQTLETDPRLNAFAAYERLRAHQGLDAALAIRNAKQHDVAMAQADRRVAIAELSARSEATRRQIDALERQRSELLVEASRQDANRARQEAERLRVQAQIQAEEAQRLRAAAEAEAAARQQAEDVIIDVGADETTRLKAARERDAELARQEAALMAPGKTGSKAVQPAKPSSRTKSKSKSKARKH